ncbi:MAG: hypothetical protein ACREDR_14905 [Blastocatellia bacterium]
MTMMVELKPEDGALIDETASKRRFCRRAGGHHYALEALEEDEVWLMENETSIHEKIGEGIAALDRGEGISGAGDLLSPGFSRSPPRGIRRQASVKIAWGVHCGHRANP